MRIYAYKNNSSYKCGDKILNAFKVQCCCTTGKNSNNNPNSRQSLYFSLQGTRYMW